MQCSISVKIFIIIMIIMIKRQNTQYRDRVSKMVVNSAFVLSHVFPNPEYMVLSWCNYSVRLNIFRHSGMIIRLCSRANLCQTLHRNIMCMGVIQTKMHKQRNCPNISLIFLTLVLLNPDIPCLCKQCRSRSVGFWRSQLIWICTVCH